MTETLSFPPQRLEKIVNAMRRTTIIVAGDCMIDEYFWGDVDRISPEAPVPVVAVESVSRRLGGAANVVQNLSKLGVRTHLIAVCGTDENGVTLGGMLREIGCSAEGLFRSPHRPTSIKTRIIARHQQVVRADRELIADLDEDECAALTDSFDRFHGHADGVIIADYGKGVVSPALAGRIMKKCAEKNTFTAIDPKERSIHLYRGASVITPNLKEAHTLAGVPYRHCSDEEINALGWKIIDIYNTCYLLITLSERGMALFCRDGQQFTRLPTVAQKVFDVTGAGDTVISVFTAAIAGGATPPEAAFLANHAAGLTVAQLGTVSVGPEELLAACA
ncbi:MAG: bifunctional hydroxymethylpyrimidine kinase/phosphomethylpyrimidine kinase [Chitinispirillaceae bacterium]|nr:bifunctional hydroxymethylpyrimidine kinase/phosphomethylpyrimidine kinase [Chitinispirillaceae bacterium]